MKKVENSVATHESSVSAFPPPLVHACEQYRLEVIALSAHDIVASAGGWLVDRALAGWRITAVVADLEDVAPLKILGVTDFVALADLHSDARGGSVAEDHASALAVCGELVADDIVLRRQVLAALGLGTVEVVAWGEGLEAVNQAMNRQFRQRFSLAQYASMTPAARVFKLAALRAAGAGDWTTTAESFSKAVQPVLRYQSDLSLVPHRY